MEINSNNNNQKMLRNAFSQVKEGNIYIASGWIRSHMLKDVLQAVEGRIRKGKVNLFVILRIGEPIDLKISDFYVFDYLKSLKEAASEKGGTVEFRFNARHHAKIYIAHDQLAMLGSYNLTSGGFGTDERPGNNPEAGSVTHDPSEIQKVKDRFLEIWDNSHFVNSRLAAFVSNGASNREFWALALGPVPAGKFLQYHREEASILCKVEETFAFHEDFPLVNGETPPPPDIFPMLNSPDSLYNQLQGLALSGTKAENQLYLIRAKGIHTIHLVGGKMHFSPVNLPPRVASPLWDADPEQLEQLFNPQKADYAVLEENPDVPVSILEKEILSKHMAVLGSTGSGKSYFVKQLIRHRLQKRCSQENLRVVIIDTHGEYNPSLPDMMGIEDMQEILNDPQKALDARAIFIDGLEAIKEQLGTPSALEKKILQQIFREIELEKNKTNSFLKLLKKKIQELLTEESEELDWKAILDDYYSAVDADDFEKGDRQSFINDYRKDLLLAESVQNQSTSEELISLAKNRAITKIKKIYQNEIQSDIGILNALVERLENKQYRLDSLNLVQSIFKPGLYRLDLSAIHEAETRQAIVGDLMLETYNRAKENGAGSFNTLFIVDEAQNYASEKSSKSIPSFSAMKVIASEGRKFQIALLVMTQRPAYLSKDILSQCNTQAIFRLVNSMDINAIKETVEGISEYDLLQLPTFVPGQGIFTGVGMKMPVRVKINE